MAGSAQAPSIATLQREAAEKHNRVLLHAWQTAHPVLYQDRHHFIQVLRFGATGCGQDVEVYLAGDPTCLRPDQVQLAKQIDKPDAAPAAPESTP
jgi:hypothetical protein